MMVAWFKVNLNLASNGFETTLKHLVAIQDAFHYGYVINIHFKEYPRLYSHFLVKVTDTLRRANQQEQHLQTSIITPTPPTL